MLSGGCGLMVATTLIATCVTSLPPIVASYRWDSQRRQYALECPFLALFVLASRFGSPHVFARGVIGC